MVGLWIKGMRQTFTGLYVFVNYPGHLVDCHESRDSWNIVLGSTQRSCSDSVVKRISCPSSTLLHLSICWPGHFFCLFLYFVNRFSLSSFCFSSVLSFQREENSWSLQHVPRGTWGRASPQKQLTWACGSSWTLNWKLGNLSGTKLGSLNVGNSYVAWFGRMTVGPGLTLGAWTGFWEYITYGVVFCSVLIWKERFSPFSTWYVGLCWLPEGSFISSEERMEVYSDILFVL